MRKMLSSCGSCVVQENGTALRRGVNLHCASRNVPMAKMGSENALIAQATNAGPASRSMRLFRMGSTEVKTVAVSARKAYIGNLSYRLPLQFIRHQERVAPP